MTFAACARTLDRQRLGRQRIEVLALLQAIADGPTSPLHHHSLVRMWAPYQSALVRYGLEMCGEWQARGYKDTYRDKIARFASPAYTNERNVVPHWLTPEFRENQRHMLATKDPSRYAGMWRFTRIHGAPVNIWPPTE